MQTISETNADKHFEMIPNLSNYKPESDSGLPNTDGDFMDGTDSLKAEMENGHVGGGVIAVDPGTDKVGAIKPKSQIGLLGGISFTAGSIIGSGIFISPKGALDNVGSVGMSLVVWAFCGVVTMVLGLLYAELGTLIPQSGGDYTYINKGLGAFPAFIAVWVTTLVNYPGSITLLSMVFADYLCAPIFGDCGPPDSIRKSIAAMVIVTLAITNVISVRFAASSQMVFAIAKSIALVVISVGGIVYLGKGRLENFENSFDGTSVEVTAYTLAIYKCMWAYAGYNHANEITEELINPKRNIPRVIIISILFVTTVYLLANISYFVMLPKSEFLDSASVAYDWGRRAIPPAAILIPIGVCCSVYGSANVKSFTTGRIMFAAARNSHFPEVVSYLHMRTLIPTLAIIITHVIALLLLIPGDIAELINFLGFTTFFVIGLSGIALMRVRYNRRNTPDNGNGFRAPIILPILAVLFCVFMVVSPFLSTPKIEFIYGAVFIVLGAVVYIPMVHFQLAIPGWDKTTTFIQLLSQVTPTLKVD